MKTCTGTQGAALEVKRAKVSAVVSSMTVGLVLQQKNNKDEDFKRRCSNAANRGHF